MADTAPSKQHLRNAAGKGATIMHHKTAISAGRETWRQFIPTLSYPEMGVSRK